MKSNKGFSLVELIVVIAIMAIIAGVAIPVYSGYIDKANKAASQQVIDEVEHAIKIAGAEHGTLTATYKADAEAKTVTYTITSANKADVIADVATVLAGNSDITVTAASFTVVVKVETTSDLTFGAAPTFTEAAA